MNLKWLIWLVCCCPFLLSAAPCLTVLGSSEYDFGNFFANSSRSTVFVLTNSGDAPLALGQIHSTCGCLATSIAGTTLAPGARTELKVTLLPNTLRGRFEKSLYLRSDDPVHPVMQITLRGEALPLVTVLPGDNFFAGYLPPDRLWQQRFQLKTEPSFGLVRFGEVSVSGASCPVTAMLNRDGSLGVTADPAGKSELRARVSIPVIAPAGWPPVVIEIHGFFGYGLYAEPARLLVPVRPDAATFTRKFVLRLEGNLALQREKIGLPVLPGMTARVLSVASGRAEIEFAFDARQCVALTAGKKTELTITYPGTRPATIALVPLEALRQ